MILSQMSVVAAGCPGVKAWRKPWRWLFADFDQVIVLADGDEAGREFGKRMVEELGSLVSTTMVECPAGEDTNSLYVKHGPEAVRQLLRGL